MITAHRFCLLKYIRYELHKPNTKDNRKNMLILHCALDERMNVPIPHLAHTSRKIFRGRKLNLSKLCANLLVS